MLHIFNHQYNECDDILTSEEGYVTGENAAEFELVFLGVEFHVSELYWGEGDDEEEDEELNKVLPPLGWTAILFDMDFIMLPRGLKKQKSNI